MTLPSRPNGAPAGWTVVLPLKGGSSAKSRLAAGPLLARAIALDTQDAVAACRDVARLLVVTADPWLLGRAGEPPVELVAESRPGAGLAAALGDGLAVARSRRPDDACAVLLGDLPALRPADLTAALEAAGAALASGHPMAFVPDADGTGTVLLAALRPQDLVPAFGTASAAAHRQAGAVPLELDLPRLRRDVDTRDDLAQALRLGAGPRTTHALLPRYSAAMQATVYRYDADSRSGDLVTDDGVLLPFGAAALEAGGLRHLRTGQRLTVTLAEPLPPGGRFEPGAQPQVVRLSLGTIRPPVPR